VATLCRHAIGQLKPPGHGQPSQFLRLSDRLRPLRQRSARCAALHASFRRQRQSLRAARPKLDEYVLAALRAGASGFLLKDSAREDLYAAVRTIAAGDALLAPV
jgi:hypothetical protein